MKILFTILIFLSISNSTLLFAHYNGISAAQEVVAGSVSRKVFDPGIHVNSNGLVFQLGNPDTLRGKFMNLALRAVSGLLGFPKLQRVFLRARDFNSAVSDPVQNILRAFDLRVRTHNNSQAWEKDIKEGPLLVVANHPLAGLEGLAIAHALNSVGRRKVKIVTNYLLEEIPVLNQIIIPIDPFEKRRDINFRALRDMNNWLQAGNALIIFPAGAISGRANIKDLFARHPVDSAWQPGIEILIRRVRPKVLPVFVHGYPSNLFLRTRALSSKLSHLLLLREMTRLYGSEITLTMGSAISPDELLKLADKKGVESMLSFLRARVYMHGERTPKESLPRKAIALVTKIEKRKSAIKVPRRLAEIAPRVNPVLLQSEIDSLLSTGQLLFEQGDFQVFCATTASIPNILREIGVLREVTFRAEGEGSGNALDLDMFDNYYRHLFVWDRSKNAIAGAYRIGLGDEVLKNRGLRGLYISTLFSFDRSMHEMLAKSLEMGRSFVVQNYQQSSPVLNYLWRGIALFVFKHPQYRYLIGPVSISGDYLDATKALMLRYLRTQHTQTGFNGSVRPLNPPHLSHLLSDADLDLLVDSHHGLKRLSQLIAAVEPGHNGVPTLVRQYISLLSAALLTDFHYDKDFNTLDGLIVVDLLSVPERNLAQFVGRDLIVEFLSRLRAAHPRVDAEDITRRAVDASSFMLRSPLQ